MSSNIQLNPELWRPLDRGFYEFLNRKNSEKCNPKKIEYNFLMVVISSLEFLLVEPARGGFALPICLLEGARH